MSKVYIVTAGSYSDYHIISVFTDRQKAEHFVKVYNKSAYECDLADIETWDVSDSAVNVEREEVLVEYYPKTNFITFYSPGDGGVTVVEEDRIIERDYPYNHRDYGKETQTVFQFMLDVSGRDRMIDREKLTRIAQDRYAMAKARKANQ